MQVLKQFLWQSSTALDTTDTTLHWSANDVHYTEQDHWSKSSIVALTQALPLFYGTHAITQMGDQ